MSLLRKFFLRGSAKGTTTEGDVTSTNVDSNTQALDVAIKGQGYLDTNNSTSTPLNAGATFTGTSTEVLNYPSLVVALRTDQKGTLVVQFSTDNVNWDSALTFSLTANVNEVHRIVVTRRYMRVVITNTSASNQTFLRCQTILGQQSPLTSPLNSTIQSDADSLVVRALDFNLMVAEGLYQNRNNFIKDGLNFDIDTGTVPEDVSNEGGIYAGFPTGAPQAGQVVVAGADTGTVYYAYLASSSDTDYSFGSVAIAGAGTYALGHNIWRCNFAYFVANSSTAFNVGDITIRNTPTTANVFCVIPAGYSQSYCSAYTVPSGNSIYLDRINGNVRGTTSAVSLDGVFWFRPFGESPRYRFPFELQYGGLFFDDIDYLVKIPALTDIVPRIIASSGNNITAKVSYRFIKVIDI